MLAHARRSAAPASYAVADAAGLPRADASVHCVGCSLGPVQGAVALVAETRRVLTTPGWLTLATWGDDYSELRLLTEARRRHGLPRRPVTNSAQLVERLEAGGLSDVEVEDVRLPVVHESVEAYLEYRSAFGVVPDLTPAQHASVVSSIAECATQYLDGSGRLVLDWHVLVATGTV